MKNLILLIALVLVCSFAPAEPVPFKITWYLVIAFVVGIYEVIVRLIPSIGQNGIIGKIIDILKWLSDFLNNHKSSKSKKS